MAATRSFRLVSALIAEPRKHIDAIPPFINLPFSRPLQIPSKLFSAAFYSTLKNPTSSAASFESTPIAAFYSTLKNPTSSAASFESTPIAKFLLNECGFSLEDAKNICRRKPDLLAHKSYDNSRQTLLFLRDKGFHEISVQKLFSKYSNTLRCSFEDIVKPKVEFLEKIGLTGQKLSKALSRDPRILTLSISRTLELRFYYLQSVLDPESDKIPGSKLVSNHSLTVSVICAQPRVLAFTTARSLGIVKGVEGLGIEKGSKAFARAFIRLGMLNRDTVRRKLENLRELGFREEEVRSLIKKFPEVLGRSENKLRQNFKFLVEEWKLPRNVILGNPAALHYSIEKRMKPRLNVFRALMMNKSLEKSMSYPPVRYLTMSEKDFHTKVVGRFAA